MARFPSRSRSERGATLVEYVVLISVFVIPATLGVQFMQDGAEAKIGHVASGVAHADSENPTTTIDGETTTSTTTTSTTTTTAPTTTTTRPPSTTVAPPTTTRPPSTTTTTTSTTTTTVKASKSTGSMSQATSTAQDKNYWTSATTITVKDNLGKPVVGAKVDVKVRTFVVDKKGKGTWVETTQQGTTNSSGVVVVTVKDMARKAPYVDQIEFSVTAITFSGLTWDGKGITTSADKP